VGGGAGALVLAGAAGAGKTTLLRAGAALASGQGLTVLQTTPVRSELPLAFAGLTDLLEQHLDPRLRSGGTGLPVLPAAGRPQRVCPPRS
jgi:ABC-type cobalamin transport system ATPase subunit